MPATLSPLVEYLLGCERPGGGKLCQMGAVQTTIDPFPPGLQVIYDITPQFNSFCNIEFTYYISEYTPPGVFTYAAYHQDYQITSGLLYPHAIDALSYFWMEITTQKPLTSIWTNNSTLNQFLMAIDVFLIVKSEQDLATIRQIVKLWNQGFPADLLDRSLERFGLTKVGAR